MKCAICGIQIDSVEEAVEAGWTPYFYEGQTEHEVVCPNCAGTFLQQGEHGEMEVKEEYRVKIRFMGIEREGKLGRHLAIGIAIKETAGKKH